MDKFTAHYILDNLETIAKQIKFITDKEREICKALRENKVLALKAVAINLDEAVDHLSDAAEAIANALEA